MAADTAELRKREWGFSEPSAYRAKRWCLRSALELNFSYFKPTQESRNIRTAGLIQGSYSHRFQILGFNDN